MITERTKICTFYNEKNKQCKLLANDPFNCEICLAFRVFELAPHEEREEEYEDFYND